MHFGLFSRRTDKKAKKQPCATSKKADRAPACSPVVHYQCLPAVETLDDDGTTVFRTIGQSKLDLLDPFLLLDEFEVAPPAGFADHLHRGFSTVTYMLEGSLLHRDSKGNAGEIRAGGIHILTAGKGVVHSEMPGPQGGRGLQLWVNLAAKEKMTAPTNQQLDHVPQAQQGGVTVNVVFGEAFGVKSSVDLHPAVVFLDVIVPRYKRFQRSIPQHYAAFAYVIEGAGMFGDTKVRLTPKNLLVLNKDKAGCCGGIFTVENLDTDLLRFVFIAGQPLNEPVFRHGPFVMNTREEVMQALHDYHSGAFMSA